MSTAGRVRALLFDFDGLLVDTESPAFEPWQAVYAAHGVRLDLERWAPRVGTLGHPFDPLTHLASLVGRTVDGPAVLRQRAQRQRELLGATTLRPGAADYLLDAGQLGLRCAIVTSNTGASVREHVRRLEIEHRFTLIESADGDRSRAKPAPTLYLAALERLQLTPAEVVVFEDSPNGVAAAKAVGAFCVAVPNAVTVRLDLSAADLCIDSMAELPLASVLALANGDTLAQWDG